MVVPTEIERPLTVQEILEAAKTDQETSNSGQAMATGLTIDMVAGRVPTALLATHPSPDEALVLAHLMRGAPSILGRLAGDRLAAESGIRDALSHVYSVATGAGTRRPGLLKRMFGGNP